MNDPIFVGALVQVLPPFAADLPGVYEVTEIVEHEDGQMAVILGDLGGFDPQYLGAAE